MDRFVKITFDGTSDLYFKVSYQIFDANRVAIENGSATLPACPELAALLQSWLIAYRTDVRDYFHFRIEHPEESFSHSSDINHDELTAKVLFTLNTWLNSPEFMPVKHNLWAALEPNQVVLIGIEMSDPDLKHIPWSLWDFFEKFQKSDFALLRSSSKKIQSQPRRKSKLNVLTIIGDSRGIDAQGDAAIIKGCPRINSLKVLQEPLRRKVKDVLGGATKYDILLFAGHGKVEQRKGKICINEQESLSIEDVKNLLSKQIKQGLQLAFFNSCDGLELGEEIADLQIPQAIVMMEAVPDKIAQKILRYLLEEFSQGVPLVEALRETRNKLIDEKDEYPYASWLPVLYYNPMEPLMEWPKPHFVEKYPLRTALAASCLIGLVVMGAIQPKPPTPTPTPAITPQNEVINVEDSNLSLERPEGWVKQYKLDGVMGDKIQIHLKDNLEVKIELSVRELNPPRGKEDYYKDLVVALEYDSGNLEIKKEEATLLSQGGYRLLFSSKIENKVRDEMLVFALKNNKAYIIRYSAPKEVFAKYKPVAEEIFYSLKFIAD